MEQYVYQEYRETVHYSNRTGVRATCPDCHVPKEWSRKVIRKIQATNELYQWLRGSIDTREKFEAKRFELAGHVWASMRETDSQECRNCHQRDHMAIDIQIPLARKMHQLGELLGNTCIECHQGIAHELPVEFDKEVLIDEMHHLIEEQQIPCHECHGQLYAPADDEEW
jgi:cytochrome c-type protein NapC